MRQEQYYQPPDPANSNQLPYQMPQQVNQNAYQMNQNPYQMNQNPYQMSQNPNAYQMNQNQNQYQMQQMGSPQIVVVQKQIVVEQQKYQGPNEFIQPLCGCTKNCCICLAVFCIPYAANYFHAVAVERATKGHHGCCPSFCLDCFCCCINRGTIRNSYNIEGSCCGDFCVMAFCQPCATLQDYYEVEMRDSY